MPTSRRDILKILSGVAASAPFFVPHAGFGSEPFPQTALALRDARLNERRAYKRYIAATKQAANENYLGVAYLFTALGTSELIHAQNYERVLSVLGHPIEELEFPDFEVSGTKNNLIRSAEAEINSIENFYPSVVERLQSELHEDAQRVVGYSWESHKQHREIIDKVLRWSPSKFEKVARKIDKKTDKYYVCQICGSTDVEIPEESCEICSNGPDNYRLIAPDVFL